MVAIAPMLPHAPIVIRLPLSTERGVDLLIPSRGNGSKVIALPMIGEFRRGFDNRWLAPARDQAGRYGLLEADGEWRLTPRYDEIRTFSADGLARFRQGERWGYLDATGAVTIPAQFPEAKAFVHGLACVSIAPRQWQVIDCDGRFTFATPLLGIGDFSAQGLAAAARSVREGKVGYIDREGEWRIPPRFRSNAAFGDGGVAPASMDDRAWGLINQQGEWLQPPRFSRIRDFNEDGLAFFSRPKTSAEDQHGYLDPMGEIRILGDLGLSERMVAGRVAAESGGETYWRSDGRKLEAPRLSWSVGFCTAGFTLARSVDFLWSESKRRHEPRIAQWGVLDREGGFHAVPENILEPLTDAEGWVRFPRQDSPLLPMLGKDGQLYWLNADTSVCFRAQVEAGQARLFDADGELLWQSGTSLRCAPAKPFFERPPTDFLCELAAPEQVLSLVDCMRTQLEQRLRAFARGESVPESDLACDDDLDEDADDPDNDPIIGEPPGAGAQAHARLLVLTRRLGRAYLDEGANGYYPFLAELHQRLMMTLCQRLQAEISREFGEPDCDPEMADLFNYPPTVRAAWPISLGAPLTESAQTFPEANLLWLLLCDSGDSGDGDTWQQIHLLLLPSKDAFDLARRLRPDTQAIDPARLPISSPPQPEITPPPPQTYAEWKQAVCDHRHLLASVPEPWLDEELIDAALQADVRAFEELPVRFRSEQRLQALVRRGLSTARSIPPICMTPTALALARELYGDEPEWDWHEQRYGKLPTCFDHNSLYDVFGALLSEQDCLQAVRAGARLNQVPPWLRTPALEQVAVMANSFNVLDIDPAKITEKLADRAVRHAGACVLHALPLPMRTPARVLLAVKERGLSLREVPLALRTIEVCVAALLDADSVFAEVPAELRIAVCTRLIDQDLRQAKAEGDTRSGSMWHGYRAWAHLWLRDYPAAAADAELARTASRYPEHSDYVLALAQAHLGHWTEAAAAASRVLARQDPYQAEFNADEDTRWLSPLAKGRFDQSQDDALIAALSANPGGLADIARARINEAMVAAALAADENVIRHVPKRLMSPHRYLLALRTGAKTFANIPSAMLSEATCIELVQDNGLNLAKVPEAWRSIAVCVAALREDARALEYVPTPLQAAVTAALRGG